MTDLQTKRNGKPVSPLSIRDTAARMSELQKRRVWQAADTELRLFMKQVWHAPQVQRTIRRLAAPGALDAASMR